ncbi:TraB/GumN family protein, partial [Ramlibacter sp.]|uniref:TraB/GumN family protein n=1 Tax=Ramlibacter sp. TaxID=1917967 RepID=UPI00182ADA15
GVLWRLDKDGRTSWLYGTMHVGRLEWLVPGPRVGAALRASDTVALELDLGDPREQQVLSQPADPAIAARVLDAGRRERIRQEAARACLPEAALATLRPFMQAMALTLGAARRQGLHFEAATEFLLMGVAQATGKRLVGLERAADQLAVLTPADDAEERDLVDQALDDLGSAESSRMLDKMASTWADGDVQALENFKQWCRCMDTPAEQALFRRINDARNPGMADRLAALHAGGARVFAGVGMLHMAGPQALPGLMRARGFAVSRIAFGAAE